DYTKMARAALQTALGLENPTGPEKHDMRALLSRGVDVQIREQVTADPSLIGQTVPIWVLANGEVDALVKGAIDRDTPEDRRQLNDKQLEWIDRLAAEGRLEKHLNTGLFTYGASSQPETSGLGVALIGSFYMMLIVALVAVPLGVAAAAYLEEFA